MRPRAAYKESAIEREAGRFPGLAVGSFYNVSARASCSVRGEANGFGRILATAKSWLCEASSGLPDDIVVAVLSNFGIPAQTDDAESLRSLLRALTDQGKKVVVVAHSDGNHVTRDALQRMRRGTVEDARRSQAIGVVMVGSPLPPEDMPVAGAVENGNYDNLAWVGLHHDPVAILGAFNALDESDFWGLTPELARLQLEIDAAMVHASVPWPFDLLVGQSRAEALADLAEALQDVIDEADRIGGSVPSLIRNSTGNGHNFVSSYLGTGSTSAQKILNEIARIRGNLPHPQDVNEAEEASSSLVSASGSFRANDGEFEVAVSPQDSKGNFVGEDLPPTSFAFENVIMTSQATGQQVSLSAKTTGMQVDLPISSYLTAVVLLDTSGSMRENDPLGNGRRDGADAFFAKLGGRDEVAVLDFPGTGTSRMLQDFTSDQTLLRAAVSSLADSGGTPLYHAVLDGLDLLELRIGGGGALIVLTDGIADGGSPVTQAVSQAQTQQTPVFAVGLGANIDFTELRNVGQDTGGAFAEAGNAQDLAQVFGRIATGITVGRVTVFGSGQFNSLDYGRYEVKGTLVTRYPEAPDVETPFSFSVDVQP